MNISATIHPTEFPGESARLFRMMLRQVLLICSGLWSVMHFDVNAAETREPEGPLSLELVYKGEVWSNVSGGLSQDSTYLDNLDLVATLDAEQYWGWEKTILSASVLYNNGNTFSDVIVGDTQVISNIDTNGSVRLYEAWIERGFSMAAIKAGLTDLNSEFDSNETGGFFLNSSHGIGPDFSQVGENGPSIFPITGLAILTRINVSPAFQLRLGAFEGIPGDTEQPERWKLRLDDDEGHLLVGELEYQLAEDKRAYFGLRRLTRRDNNPDDPADDKAQLGAYGLVEGRVADWDASSLDAFFRLGWADPDTQDINGYFGAGTVLSGPIFMSEIHQEQFGLAIGVIRNADRFRQEQALLGFPVDQNETAIELTYRVQASSWLAIQPNIQYIVNPGTNPELKDALSVGVRFEINWNTNTLGH